MSGCRICAEPRREVIESFGRRAMLTEISWRNAALLAGVTNPASLKNHMEKHSTTVASSDPVSVELDRIKGEVEQALLAQADASHDPDEKARIWLKLKELRSPNVRPDVLIRIWKEERELDNQKGIAAALTMFGRTMFQLAAPQQPLAIEAEVIDADSTERAEPQPEDGPRPGR